MKKISLSRALLFIVMFLFIAACTKDTQLPVNYTKAVKLDKEPPAPNYGTIKGYVTPVPQEANFKLISEELTLAGKVNGDGSIYMENVPANVYTLNIYYLVSRAEYSYYTTYEVQRVAVTGGIVTELGEVRLPWTY